MSTTTQDAKAILAPFGLVPSEHQGRVFASRLIDVASMIRSIYPVAAYDHKPTMPEYDKQFPYIDTEQFRRGYAAFKHTVASVIRPKTITEIGIGAGVAALAFLAACPEAFYTGIDDGSKNLEDNHCGVTDHAISIMKAKQYRHHILIADSMKLAAAPRVDLFHVDGAHDFEHAQNDTRLAFESGSEWILVDDSSDLTVASAAMQAAKASGAYIHWAYFEDTWTGSILFHRVNG